MKATRETVRISNSYSVPDDSINASRVISLDDSRQYFVKTNAQANGFPEMFETEYKGLALLSEPGVIRISEALVFVRDFIVMEVIKEG